MLCWFIWENIEVDCIISVFSFSDYGLTAVQFFDYFSISPRSVAWKNYGKLD